MHIARLLVPVGATLLYALSAHAQGTGWQADPELVRAVRSKVSVPVIASGGAGELEDTTFVLEALSGGFSGGTVASLKGELDEVRGDKAAARIVSDPYALSPDRAAEPELGSQRDLRGVEHDDALGTWLAPFVMAQINTRVVRRSNALLGHAYGRRFRYREVMSTGGGPLGPVKAGAVAGGAGALIAGLSFGPTRTVLDRVLPAPG
ncbi:MAG: hypothetical protein KY464_03470, partial [Gemmatimonadetes bacterium]|nr:hypothetical protein [Gemmatimonadota bacterium]